MSSKYRVSVYNYDAASYEMSGESVTLDGRKFIKIGDDSYVQETPGEWFDTPEEARESAAKKLDRVADEIRSKAAKLRANA